MSNNIVRSGVLDIQDKIISIRRLLHKNPELGFEEFVTSSILSDFLKEAGLEVKTGLAKTGLTALLSGNGPGKTLAIRADIDALPITELNTFEYVSANEGRMHACGHDIHMAVVLGTANVLSNLRDRFPGNVKFIFQPAEEGLGGAKTMIDEGVLKNPDVDAVIAAHVEPGLNTGSISVRPGPVMATPSEFEIEITGKGGHAALPHKAINPVVIAADVVDKLGTIVKSISGRAVLSVTCLHAGNAYNIIPDTAVIKGTVRTFDTRLSQDISKEMKRITAAKVNEAGAGYSFKYNIGFPPVVNDARMVDALIGSAGKILMSENIITNAEPSMLAEDFAYYAQLVPGVFFHLGCKDPMCEVPCNLHSSKFNADEACIPTGMEIMSRFALDYLGTSK